MKLTPARIFWVGAVAVAASFLLAKATSWISADELSALYTGLGFAGLLATFFHEREEAAERDKEQAQLFMQMRAQSKATCHAARVAAIGAALDHWRNLRTAYYDKATSGKAYERRVEITDKIRLLEQKLDDACETTEVI